MDPWLVLRRSSYPLTPPSRCHRLVFRRSCRWLQNMFVPCRRVRDFLVLVTVVLSLLAAARSVRAASAQLLVVHAEPPADSPLARVMKVTARVEVSVDSSGTVTNAAFLEPCPPFVVALSEAAARKWRFGPDASRDLRSYVITFVYMGVSLRKAPSERVVSADDPLTLRIRYLQSTIVWLPRDANGKISPAICPRHGTQMSAGLVPIVYGLPRSYSSNVASDRRALRKAQKFWRASERLFPEANTDIGGGCLIGPEDQAERHYCEECRRARTRWLQQHRSFEE